MTDTPSPHPVAPAPATADELLEVYDTHLREGEMLSADSVEQVGPVLVGRYGRSRGFISYRDLGGLDASGIADLVAEVVAPLQAGPVHRGLPADPRAVRAGLRDDHHAT